MRLICPNCDAQYEIDDGAIPESGRDVQCSNCGHAWFQTREVLADDPTDALYREPEPEAIAEVPAALVQTDAEPEVEEADPPPRPSPAPVQRTLDDSVLSVLREEAEREMAARRAEAQAIETQGDLGLPPPVSPVVGSAAAAAAASAAARGDAPQAQRRSAARRDLLPDIEEINSSLRPNDMSSPAMAPDAAAERGSGTGFRSGFVSVLVVAGIAVAIYVMAPQISAQIPGTTEAMVSYVSMVDSLRLSLDQMMRQATGALNGLSGS